MTLWRKDVFYLFLSSEDSKDLYPQNTPQDFTVQLPERIQLTGEWTLALVEIEYPTSFSRNPPASLWFEVDLCETSIVGDRKLPVLRRLPVTSIPNNETKRLTFDPLLHLPIRQYDFDKVHIHIKEPTGLPASFADGLSSCTLQFLKV